MIEIITEPLIRLWEGVSTSFVGIIAAILILLIGYIVAYVLGRVVDGILTKIKFDEYVLRRTHASHVIGEFRLSHFLGLITKWFVFILFLPSAADVIGLTSLQVFLMEVSLWIPRVIVAVILGLVGLIAAEYVGEKIMETRAKAGKLVSGIARFVIWVFTALIVLDQIGVDLFVANTSFLIVLSGIMLGIALMVGIGFGLALKDDAKKIISDVKRRL